MKIFILLAGLVFAVAGVIVLVSLIGNPLNENLFILTVSTLESALLIGGILLIIHAIRADK